MNANLYLFNPSFLYKEGITLNELYEQIQELHITINYIRELSSKFNDSDHILRYEGIYEIKIYQNLTVSQILYDPNIFINIPRDIKRALTLIVDHVGASNLNETDVINTLKNNNKYSLNGLLILHSNNFDEIYPTLIIKTKENWYEFHRYFLAINSIDEKNFYNECRKYFPQLSFHPNVEISLRRLEGGLKNFAGSIIYNLTQLNDKFKSYCSKYDLVETLRRFSSECQVDASLEGNASRKSEFTFIFNQISVCCEPHLKLSKSDLPGEKDRFYSNRIYFHEGKPTIEGGKILVAHIGKHL